MEILYAVSALGALGLIFGGVLGFASKIFAVKHDGRIDEIVEVLPNANCGGCGFAGCSAFATAVAEGRAKVDGCPVGGQKVAEQVSRIMGVEPPKFEKRVAKVFCSGDREKAQRKYDYEGFIDCFYASALGGGPKSCQYGCIGNGTCVRECAFDAIHIVNGIAKVDPEKCTACGKCERSCPKNIIHLVPYSEAYFPLCNSKDKGAVVRKVCEAGCIGCKLCEKACPFDAIHVKDNLAVIDYDKCKNCGACEKACPRKIIKKVRER